MCTFLFNRKHIHSPKSASFQKMYNIPGLRKRSISCCCCSLQETTVMNLAKHLILHIFTICVNVYIICLKREAFMMMMMEKIEGAYVFPKANQVAPLVSALVKQILHSRSFFAFLLQAADTILHLLSYVLKPI